MWDYEMHNNKRDAGKKDCPDELKGGRGGERGEAQITPIGNTLLLRTYVLPRIM